MRDIKTARKETGVKPKQAQFIEEYVRCGMQGKKAAINCGYAEKSAKVTASRWLAKPESQAYLDYLMIECNNLSKDRIKSKLITQSWEDSFNNKLAMKDQQRSRDQLAKLTGAYEISEEQRDIDLNINLSFIGGDDECQSES